ncbi:kinase-like domain-containing protein [Lentinula aff. detonsa]|nr:kinase-like domain-containing protein [Lentinula aff. detonsa]
MNSTVNSDDTFRSERDRIRKEDSLLRARSNLFTNCRFPKFGPSTIEIWRDDGVYINIRESAVPGTLSNRILSLQADIPPLETHSEIFGDDISRIAYRDCPLDVQEEEPDPNAIISQSAREAIDQLPIIPNIDISHHFVKETKSSGEIFNLLKAKGGPHIVELLGRTEDGKLVFPSHINFAPIVFMDGSISDYKRVLLQLADAVIFLHSIGIIHRDLAIRNILATKDRQSVVLCDLESLYGSNACPEISSAIFQDLPDTERPYSAKSDVFCFGTMIADFILVNNIMTPWQYHSGGFIPPPPFRSIVEACIRRDPADRPSMLDVKAMLEAIVEPVGDGEVA